MTRSYDGYFLSIRLNHETSKLDLEPPLHILGLDMLHHGVLTDQTSIERRLFAISLIRPMRVVEDAQMFYAEHENPPSRMGTISSRRMASYMHS